MRISKTAVLISTLVLVLLGAVAYHHVSAQDIRFSRSYNGAPAGPETKPTLFDEFTSASTHQALNWALNGGGGGATVQPCCPLPAGHIGIMEITSGGTGTSWEYYMLADQNTFLFDPTTYNFNIWSDVQDTNASLGGIVRYGVFDTSSMNNLTPNNAIFFEADSSGSAPNWTCVLSNSGTRTTASSGVTAPLNVFHELGISFDGAGAVNWFVDAVQVCTSLTGTVPSANMDVGFQAADNASHLAKLWIDYFRMNATLTR
jgi:hypothetical protein